MKPILTMALVSSICAALVPAAAAETGGPTIGGAVAVGQSHVPEGPRLDARIQGWLPASWIPSPLRVGVESALSLEGPEDGGPCAFDADDASGDEISIGRACIEFGVGARLLVGAEWGQRLVGRIEGGVGPLWRHALELSDGDARDDAISLSLVGRMVGLINAGRLFGGHWRLGISAEISSLDARAPAYAGGFVFEAVVFD